MAGTGHMISRWFEEGRSPIREFIVGDVNDGPIILYNDILP